MAVRNLLLLPGILLAMAIGPAAAQTAATASYIVNLGGVNIASVRFSLDDDGRSYNLDLDADITGVGQLVAQGTGGVQSSGAVADNGLASHDFVLLTHANGEDFRVSIEFGGGDVTAFRVDPPVLNNIDRVAVERKHLRGVNDMLAAFVLRAPRLDQVICQRKMQIFTGLERFDIAMSFIADDVATSPRTGYQGPVVLCGIRYKPISGHFTTSEITTFLAGSERILIWYAPLGDTGYFIPYRVLLSTSVGDLSMVLTAMKS